MTGQQWGRVDPDGTVWVRTAGGDRVVGQYPGAGEQDALAYFERKFAELESQVSLLEQRMKAGQVSAADADATITRLAGAVQDAHAVGDLDGLAQRLAGLAPQVAERRAEAERAREEARERALVARTALVEEAEAISGVDVDQIPWKASGDRLRDLFESWKSLQRESRLDKSVEDQLWKRFSHARTAFDRKRRQYFGALDEQRAAARAAKEELVARAQELSTSTDWGPTAGAYRGLMDEWKAAGRAARKDDDALWARFRAAQDTFFAARAASASQADAGLRQNLAVKEELLARAEALLPVADPQAARAALRDIQDRWEAAGKVPRADLGRVEARMRTVEQAIRDADHATWRRSNPDALARAEGVVAQLEQVLGGLRTDLESARAEGDTRRVREAEQAIEAREQWLVEARKALDEFGG